MKKILFVLVCVSIFCFSCSYDKEKAMKLEKERIEIASSFEDYQNSYSGKTIEKLRILEYDKMMIVFTDSDTLIISVWSSRTANLVFDGVDYYKLRFSGER